MKNHVTELLNAYHDGELHGRRLMLVKSHLAECARCRAELEELQAISSLLQSDSFPAPSLTPDQFVAQVGLRLPRQAPQPAPRSRLGWAWHLVPIGVLSVLGFFQGISVVSRTIEWVGRLGLDHGVLSSFLSSAPRMPNLLDQFSNLPFERSLSFNSGLAISLIFTAALAGMYLVWLVLWWLNQTADSEI